MKKIVIYTKSNCPNCVAAKNLLDSKGLPYEVRNLDDFALRDAFMQLFPDVRQMPQIFIDEQRVGGLAGLQAAVKQMGM